MNLNQGLTFNSIEDLASNDYGVIEQYEIILEALPDTEKEKIQKMELGLREVRQETLLTINGIVNRVDDEFSKSFKPVIPKAGDSNDFVYIEKFTENHYDIVVMMPVCTCDLTIDFPVNFKDEDVLLRLHDILNDIESMYEVYFKPENDHVLKIFRCKKDRCAFKCDTEYMTESDEDMFYGLPEEKTYPMPDKEHVKACIRIFDCVDEVDEDKLAYNIIERIKYFGMESEIKIGKWNRFEKHWNFYLSKGNDVITDSSKIFYETTSDRTHKKKNGDKYIDVGSEHTFGLDELINAIKSNAWLGCDYHLEKSDVNKISTTLNKYIKENDEFIILGDIDSKKSEPDINVVTSFLHKLKCKNVHLILGNNDSFKITEYKKLGIKSVNVIAEYKNLVLSHFPIDVPSGCVNIHAHIHGAFEEKGYNAYWYVDGHRCIDAFNGNFKPIRITDLLMKYNKRESSMKDIILESHFVESVNGDEFTIIDLFMEAVDPNGTFFKDKIAKRVDDKLKDPANSKLFSNFVNNFINRNITKLTKSGPCDMIPFTDNDHKALFDIFGFQYTIDTRPKHNSPNEILDMITQFSKEENIKMTFIQNNASQVLLYFVIRHYTVYPDVKMLNAALSIYALCVYPLMFDKYFPYGVLEPFMDYTIDNLTEKFIIKKSNHIFGALLYSIQQSYKFHKNNFKSAYDTKIIAWIERIRNDQNSLMKKIANEYMKNHKEGNAAKEANDKYDGDTPIVDDIENATASVQTISQKVTFPIVENGVDILRAEAAAKMGGVSVSDCRFYLTLIINDKQVSILQRFIEAILFLYLYEEHRTARDIKSRYFLSWSASLFKKTNSKNQNIATINSILNTWVTETGIMDKYNREATRINYKKAIFFYIVLCIQKHA